MNVIRVVKVLQFGHGCDAVETTFAGHAPEASEVRFNSATVVTPWKRRRRHSHRRGIGGFNSATVVTPWKH